MFPTGDMLRFCVGTLLFAWKSVSLFPSKMDGATASDVMELIRQIQAKVKEQFGVQLEPEIQFLGEF